MLSAFIFRRGDAKIGTGAVPAEIPAGNIADFPLFVEAAQTLAQEWG